MEKVFSISIFLIILIGCKKPADRICWKRSGKAVTEVKDLSQYNFKGFSIYNDIDIQLIPDTLNFLTINSYQNKIKQLTFSVVDSLLEIRDESKCNFLRTYDKKTNIEIHYTNLNVLSLNGKGKVSNSSPISNEIVHIYSHSCNGEIDLTINASSLVVKFVNGTLNGKIKGISESANIFHYGYSNVNFEELIVENLRVSNKSDANLYVTATSSLAVELFSLGDIYYKGYPVTEIVANTMGSELINNN